MIFLFDNTHYIDDNHTHEGRADQINESVVLNGLASKLASSVLENAAFSFILREKDKTKPRYDGLISAICAVFHLMKNANNKPIFLITDSYSSELVTGFYFFIGHFDEVKNKLEKLAEDPENLKDFDR
jgi:hypothetical protein